MLLVNSNKDCKDEFNRYVDTCVKIDKMLQKVDSYKDYEKIKNQARSEMIKKIGNQILKSIKETKTEEYQRKSAEWKEKREYWNFKTKEFEEKQGEYEARQLLYENQLRESNIRQLIQETYTLLSEENISKFELIPNILKLQAFLKELMACENIDNLSKRTQMISEILILIA